MASNDQPQPVIEKRRQRMKTYHRHLMVSARMLSAVAIVCTFLTWSSVVKAEILSWQCDNGSDVAADGALTDWSQENADAYKLSTKHSQSGGSGRMSLDFTTDTPEDPTITFNPEVENDSDAPWSGYSVVFTLDTTTSLTIFELKDVNVANPSGWTSTLTQLVYQGLNGSGKYEYVGRIDLTGGTQVGIGDVLNFSYVLKFAGSTRYSTTQDMEPVPVTVPEPGILMLLGMSAFGLLLFVWRSGARGVPIFVR
jgi:hypothetical protein